MVGQESLVAHYMTDFQLHMHYKYDLEWMDEQLPWQRQIWLSMLQNYLKEQEEQLNSRGGQAVGYKRETP